MRLMGLMAIYPQPRLSAGGPDHKVYPYLLQEVTIDKPDEASCSDITYIRLAHGFVYLVVIVDWHSRYVLSWELSTTLDKTFCLDALQRALLRSKPGIFNTDQGPQFTSEEFIGLLEREGIQVSMDGRGRIYDNIFVERLWRTVKYEEVYLHSYETVEEARKRLSEYFVFYNTECPHSAIGRRMKSILEDRQTAWRPWRLSQGFVDMDRNEIVVPRASWSEEFYSKGQKSAFLKKKGKINAGRPSDKMHLQIPSLLSKHRGEAHL